MARITIEDCKPIIPNRFELVVLAAERARRINNGDVMAIATPAKPPLAALQEIASGELNLDKLRESFVTNMQKIYIENEGASIVDIDVELAGVNIIPMGDDDRSFDFSNVDSDINFGDILLEETEIE